MKKGLVILGLLLSLIYANSVVASDGNNVSAKWGFSLDMKTQHTWRGGLTTSDFNVQPAGVFSYKNFYAGAWSIFSEQGRYAEVDLYVGYKFDRLSFTLYDYYCPGSFSGIINKFFTYSTNKGTPHLFDFSIEYTWSKDLPINFLVSSLVYNDLNEKGNEQFSTYCEVSYTEKLDFLGLKAFIGGTPHSSYYANEAALINAGFQLTYPIKIRNFELPFYTMVVSNPKKNKGYIMFGLSVNI